jgi:Transcription factor WhiB
MTTDSCFDSLIDTRLVALVEDPATTSQEWAGRAACSDITTDTYFPDDDAAPRPDALLRCAACPVALECLATALVHESVDGERFGWWGGLGPDERALVWSRLGQPTVPLPSELDLRTPAALSRHLRERNRTIPQIAAELGCTERSVYRYLAATAA